MKITKIDVMRLTPRGAEARKDEKAKFDWSNFAANCRPIVCRVYTDEGIYGDGEATMLFGVGALAAFGMLRDLAGLIIGMDPLKNEQIWDKLYKQAYFTQNGGPIIFSAVSALDNALWDIKGKYFNAPVHLLLGGKRREKLRSYASQLQFGWGQPMKPAYTVQDYIDNTKAALAEGYDCVKVDFFTYDRDGRGFTEEERTGLLSPYYLHLVEERVAAVRETIGPDRDLIVEAHSFTDSQAAIQLGRMLEKYNIFYYEEPCTPFVPVQQQVTQALKIPMGCGERIFSRWQYAPYITSGALQVLQPDPGDAGGITEIKKIADMAYIYDIGVQIHCCGTGLSVAAALNLECVIPNFVIHEHHTYNNLPFLREFCIYDDLPKDGYFQVPDRPGIGNELSDYALSTCAEKVTVS